MLTHMSVLPDSAPLRPVPAPARRTPRLPEQAMRFLLVGAVATVIDIGLFNLLHYGMSVGPITAKVLSTVAAGTIAFAGNRQLTFGDQTGRSKRRQGLRFAAVSLAALVLSVLPLAIARYGLGMTGVVALNTAANVIGLGAATVFRFYGCRRWVFPPPAEPEPEPSPEHSPYAPARERLAA